MCPTSHVLGWIASGIRASASFQIISSLVGRLGSSGIARPKRLGGQILGGLGAKPQEADAYTQIYSYEKSLFSLQFTDFDQPGLGSLANV